MSIVVFHGAQLCPSPRVPTECRLTLFVTRRLPLRFAYEAQRECIVPTMVFHGAQLCKLCPRRDACLWVNVLSTPTVPHT